MQTRKFLQTYKNLAFLQGKIQIKKYKALHSEIVSRWDDNRLEEEHGFIQWLFPTTLRSAFNRQSFPLKAEQIALINKSGLAMNNYMAGFKRIMSFYGIAFDHSNNQLSIIDKNQNFDLRFMKFKHNRMRMSRILMSLRELGKDDIAASLCQLLLIQFKSRPGYWKQMESTFNQYYAARK